MWITRWGKLTHVTWMMTAWLALFCPTILANTPSRNLLPETTYKPQLEWDFKGGNLRSLIRMGGFIPLYQSQAGLVFANLFGLLDSQSSQEGNLGLGYRHRLDESIIGVYGFWDRRKSAHGNLFSQWTMGAEWLREHLEFRINAYVPIRARKSINTTFKLGQRQLAFVQPGFEQALGGYDIEVGGNLPHAPYVHGFVAYYHLMGLGVKPVHGVRFRSKLDINSYLKLEAEVSLDRLRETNILAGLKLSLPLDGSRVGKGLLGLERKMTQMVVRDIDIVTSVGYQGQVFYINDAGIGYSEGDEAERPIGPDDFEVLGLGPDATWAEVKEARKTLLKALHPDRQPCRQFKNQAQKNHFLAIQTTYMRLSKHFQEQQATSHQTRRSGKKHRIKTLLLMPNRDITATKRLIRKPTYVQKRLLTAPIAAGPENDAYVVHHFTGGERAGVQALFFKNMRNIFVKRNDGHLQPVLHWNLEGIPAELSEANFYPFLAQSRFAVSKIGQDIRIRILGRLRGGVKGGQGNGAKANMMQVSNTRESGPKSIEIDVDRLVAFDADDHEKTFELQVLYRSKQRKRQVPMNKRLIELDSHERKDYLTNYKDVLVLPGKVMLVMEITPKRNSVSKQVEPLLATLETELDTNNRPKSLPDGIQMIRKLLNATGFDVIHILDRCNQFLPIFMKGFAWVINQSPRNHRMFSDLIKSVTSEFNLRQMISVVRVAKAFLQAPIFQRPFDNIIAMADEIIAAAEGSGEEHSEAAQAASSTDSAASSSQPEGAETPQSIEMTVNLEQTAAEMTSFITQIYPEVKLDLSPITVIFKLIQSRSIYYESLNILRESANKCLRLFGAGESDRALYLQALETFNLNLVTLVPLKGSSVSQLDFTDAFEQLPRLLTKKLSASQAEQHAEDIRTEESRVLFGRVLWKDLMFAISFMNKLVSDQITGSTPDKVARVCNDINCALKHIVDIYRPDVLRKIFDADGAILSSHIHLLQGESVQLAYREMYYQEHFMSLLKEHLITLANLQPGSPIIERVLIIRIAQILGEMARQLPKTVKDVYTPITPWTSVEAVRDAVTHPQDIVNGLYHLRYLIESHDADVHEMFSGIKSQFLRIIGIFSMPENADAMFNMAHKDYFKVFMVKLFETQKNMKEKFEALRDECVRKFRTSIDVVVEEKRNVVYKSKLFTVKPNFLSSQEVGSLNDWQDDHNNSLEQLVLPDDESKVHEWFDYVSTHGKIPDLRVEDWSGIVDFNDLFKSEEDHIKLVVFKFLIIDYYRQKLYTELNISDQNSYDRHLPAEVKTGRGGKIKRIVPFSVLVGKLEQFLSNISNKPFYPEVMADMVFRTEAFRPFFDLDTLQATQKDTWKLIFTRHTANKLVTNLKANLLKVKLDLPKNILEADKKEKIPGWQLKQEDWDDIEQWLTTEGQAYFDAFSSAKFKNTFDENHLKQELSELTQNVIPTISSQEHIELSTALEAYRFTLMRGEILRHAHQQSDEQEGGIDDIEDDFEITIPEEIRQVLEKHFGRLHETISKAFQRVVSNDYAHENLRSYRRLFVQSEKIGAQVEKDS